MIIPRFQSAYQNLVFIKIELTEVSWYIYITYIRFSRLLL